MIDELFFFTIGEIKEIKGREEKNRREDREITNMILGKIKEIKGGVRRDIRRRQTRYLRKTFHDLDGNSQRIKIVKRSEHM